MACSGTWLNECWTWQEGWHVSSDQNVIDEVQRLNEILREVEHVRGKQDSWQWFLEPNLLFTVRSCYSFLDRFGVAHDSAVPADDCLALWRTVVPFENHYLWF